MVVGQRKIRRNSTVFGRIEIASAHIRECLVVGKHVGGGALIDAIVGDVLVMLRFWLCGSKFGRVYFFLGDSDRFQMTGDSRGGGVKTDGTNSIIDEEVSRCTNK